MKLSKALTLLVAAPVMSFAGVEEKKFVEVTIPASGHALARPADDSVQIPVLLKMDRLVLNGPLYLNGRSLHVDAKEIVFNSGGCIRGFQAQLPTPEKTRNGDNGRHGQGEDGNNGRRGADGQNGADGTPGLPGMSRPGAFKLFTAAIQGTPCIHLQGEQGSNGGDAGHGGNGGNGSGGRKGSVWANRRGGRGGDGGTGGKGGDARPGGAGGGPIESTILWASPVPTEGHISSLGGLGGAAGKIGKHGTPGNPGSGGDGDSVKIVIKIVSVGGGSSGDFTGHRGDGQPSVEGSSRAQETALQVTYARDLLNLKEITAQELIEFHILRELYSLGISALSIVDTPISAEDSFWEDLEVDMQKETRARVKTDLENILKRSSLEKVATSSFKKNILALMKNLIAGIEVGDSARLRRFLDKNIQALVGKAESYTWACQSLQEARAAKLGGDYAGFTDFFEIPACQVELQVDDLASLFVDLPLTNGITQIPKDFTALANSLTPISSGMAQKNSVIFIKHAGFIFSEGLMTFETRSSHSLTTLKSTPPPKKWAETASQLQGLLQAVRYAK